VTLVANELYEFLIRIVYIKSYHLHDLQKRPERERSKMNVVVTDSDSALSTPAGPSTSQLPQAPPPSQTSAGLPVSKSNPTVSIAAKTVVKTRGRSATVVSNGAGAWGPKPKTPTVLKLVGVKGTSQAAGVGGGRVTRSVSMKEKQKEVVKDEDSGKFVLLHHPSVLKY
jgi:hypothetical protein